MKITIISLLFFSLLANSIYGQTLDEHLVTAAKNNPKLKAKYLQYQASLERIPQVGALPDPQVGFSFFLMPMERYMGNQVGTISVMQMFPWFGTLDAAKIEMSFMAKAKFEEFNETKSMLFYEVRTTWYSLQLLEKEIEIIKENIELLKTIEQIAITRFKTGSQNGISPENNSRNKDTQKPENPNNGAASGMNMQEKATQEKSSSNNMAPMGGMESTVTGSNMLNVLQVQMDINEWQNNYHLLENRKIPLISRFNQLLSREKDSAVILPETILAQPMPVSIKELPDHIKNNNPILKMLEQEEAAYLAQSKMKQKMGMPMMSLGVQYDIFNSREDSDSTMNGKNMLMPMATVTIPLWRKKYKASIRESELMRQSVMEQKKDTNNQLMVNFEDALKEYKDASRREKLYQSQIELATQAYNILMAQYTTDGKNLDDVLKMQLQLLDYRFKYLNAIIDGNMAVATMERLMGR